MRRKDQHRQYRFSIRGLRFHSRKTRGQSTVEFALISIFLFLIILGIIEMGRFLFVYSMVSNAAQEGSRYGIVRPLDVVPAAIATQHAAQGRYYLAKQIVPNGSCNSWDKSREKVWGVPRGDIDVRQWYDRGDGTPVVPNTRTPEPYTTDVVITGNRIVVEASYRFRFLTPLLESFAPNGIDVRMRSARTILNNGVSTAVPCYVNLTPAPEPTPVPSATPTQTEVPPTNTATPLPPTQIPTRTVTRTATTAPSSTPTMGTPSPTLPPGSVTPGPTRTATASATRTTLATATATRTPGSLFILDTTAMKAAGNNMPLTLRLRVSDGAAPFTGATVTVDVYVNGVLDMDNVPVPHLSGGIYQNCTVGRHRNGDVLEVELAASAPGYMPAASPRLPVAPGTFGCR